MEENIKVVTGDSRNRNVDVKNIEPITNIKVVRNNSPSVSSDSDSSDTELSEISEYIKKKPKERKKVSNADFMSFSNPKKVSKHREPEEFSEYSSESSGDESTYSEDGGPVKEKITFEQKQKMKQDLLIKIQAMEKKGFEFSKKFNMNSNYEEMMFEYEKVKKFIESQAAIKFSRRCLMACVTGLEFLNKKFDPFNVKLEGWSENVMENVDDYDNIFERLHEKYAGKAEIAPEIELLLTLGGSAFMFHLTNSLLKSPMMGSVNTVAQNNPNFMQSMMGMMSQGMKEMSNPKNVVQSNFPKPVETRGVRKEMNGPSIDPNLFAGTSLQTKGDLGNVVQYPKPPEPVQMFNQQIDDDDRFSIASSDSSLSSVVSVKKINVKGSKKQGLELNIS
uniref:Uncharacterized protein n=1 Tax=viral metagenome TaxID=1070528 RepID=A0A6C0I7S9_9ZZZZ